jgi:hypothetical protein
MYSKTVFWFFQSRKFSVAMPFLGKPGGFSSTRTIRSASAYGSGFSRAESTKLKIAVLAPIPMASVSSETMVNPGLFASVRQAY